MKFNITLNQVEVYIKPMLKQILLAPNFNEKHNENQCENFVCNTDEQRIPFHDCGWSNNQ